MVCVLHFCVLNTGFSIFISFHSLVLFVVQMLTGELWKDFKQVCGLFLPRTNKKLFSVAFFFSESDHDYGVIIFDVNSKEFRNE